MLLTPSRRTRQGNQIIGTIDYAGAAGVYFAGVDVAVHAVVGGVHPVAVGYALHRCAVRYLPEFVGVGTGL